MRSQDQFDTGVDAGRHGTALMKAEPTGPGRLRLLTLAAGGLAAVLIAAFAALTIYAYTANVSVVSAASPCPAVNDWCTTMTVADAEGDGLLHGYEFDKFGSIVDDTIQPGGANINVWTVHTFAHPHPQLPDYIFFGSNPRVPRGTQVTIEGHTFIADAESHDGEEGDTGDKWEFPSGELPASLVWSAGQEVTVSVKLASPCDNLDNLVNAIVVKNLTGEITQAGDTNLHKIRLDPYKSYLIEAIGVDGRDMLGVEEHPNLTLEDPEIPAIWNARGTSKWITYGSKSDGNAIRRILRTDHLTYKIEVSSGNNGTGTYQLKVRVNNICRINDDGDVQYQWAGGPEGYPAHSDLPAGTGGRQVLLAGTDWGNNNVTRPELHHVLGDNWDSNPDEDWIGVDLERVEVHRQTKDQDQPAGEAASHPTQDPGHQRRRRERHQRHRQRGRRREEGLQSQTGKPPARAASTSPWVQREPTGPGPTGSASSSNCLGLTEAHNQVQNAFHKKQGRQVQLDAPAQPPGWNT